jgi:polar amino acid transport system permease protein
MSEILGFALMPFLLEGALISLEITALSMLGGLAFGLVLAAMRISRLAPLRWIAWCYICFVRGTPLLLQLVFLYYVLPEFGIRLNNFVTAVLGFALNEAAFSAEYIRGGILSVNRSQTIAAAAYGMGPILTLRRIVLPQAMRAILPQVSNSVINMIKTTAVASVIFVNELSFRASQLAAQNFKYLTVFTAAGVIYFIMTSVVAVVQDRLERRFHVDAMPRGRVPSGGLLWRLRRRGMWRFRGLQQRSPEPPSAVTGSLEVPLLPLAAESAVAAGTEPFVVCRGVHKSYGTHHVLRGVDLTVNRGEVVAILGPSGSGKSTLLRMINHLEGLDAGEVTVDGKYVGYRKVGDAVKPMRDLAAARADAHIGMVFQQFNLFDHLTAIGNIMEAPVHVYGRDPAEMHKVGMELLANMALAHHADYYPHRLSGGQQQRVAIARALAISPKLILFDEPTSALDPELVGEVLSVIRKLAVTGITMIIVTHEMAFAKEIANRIVVMDGGEVVEEGSAEMLFAAPKHERTRRFLKVDG